MGTSITQIRPWGSAGTRVKPTDTQIDNGWGNGAKARGDWENERMNTRDNAINAVIAYLNAGVPLSDLLSGQKTFVGDSYIEFARNQYEALLKAEGLTVDNSVTGDSINIAADKVHCEKNSFYSEQTFERIQVNGGATGNSVMINEKIGSYDGLTLLATWITKAGLVFRAPGDLVLENVRPLAINLTGTTWTGSVGNYILSGTIFFEDHNFENRSIMGAMISWDDAVGNRRSATVREIAFVDDTADTVINTLAVMSSESPQGKSNVVLDFWYMATGGAIVP